MKWFLLLTAGCSTTINAANYAKDCDADTQCTRIVVGDICSCNCDLAAINERDFDKYFADLQRVGACRTTCIDGSDDAGFSCGEGMGAQCTAGTCTIYALPSDAAAE
jgi:hypothetical protein